MFSKMLYAIAVYALVQSASANEAVEIEKAKAAAKLKLADTSRVAKEDKCCDGINEGRKKSLATGKPLILWVSMECKEIPEVHEALKDAIHAHVKEYNGNKEAGIIVPTANGDYIFPKDKILKGTFNAQSILDLLGKKNATSKIQIEFCPTNV